MATTLVDLVLRRAEEREGVAIVGAEDGNGITYSQLATICVQFGEHVQGCGLSKGDVVSIVLPRRTSLAQVVGTLGSMFSGLVAAPLNPTYKIDELEFFISDAEAKIVIVEAQNDSGKNAWIAATRLGLPVCGMTLEWLPEPTLTMSFCQIAKRKSEESVKESDLALVLHTSGTTSRPKLVPLTHGNMVASVEAVVRHYNITKADNTLIVQPLFHIGGLVTPLLSTLSVGGTVAIARMFDDAKHWQYVEKYGVTWFTAVPTIHKVLVANAERDFTEYFKNRPKPKLRFIRSGSAALPPEFLEKIETAFGAPLIESYGMTEAAQLICANPLPPGNRYAGSVGICAGPEGKVFDAVTLKPAELDDDGSCVGEMCIAGPSVMTGYARNPEANKTSFIPFEGQRYFRTGDLVARTPEGFYSIVGRIKEIINRAGEKIAPAKLDKVLAYESRKDSVVAFGIPDPDFGQAVAAALVFDPDAGDVLSHVEARRRAELLLKKAMDKLAPHELPTTLYAITKDDVPKTATGKTRRIKCGELCFDTKTPLLKNGQWLSSQDDAPPAEVVLKEDEAPKVETDTSNIEALKTSARERARQAIAEALITVGVPLKVADDAPLMQSGLTSMMVFGFVKAVASSLELEHQLPHMLVFDAPTPAALSADLADRVVRSKLKGTAWEPTKQILSAGAKEMTEVDIAGASWRLPMFDTTTEPDPSAARGLLDRLGDTRMEVPSSRWSSESLDVAIGGSKAPNYDAIKQRCQYGGFVSDLACLDHAYFGLSKNEAQLADPQQRMLLEHVTSAFSAAAASSAAEKPPGDAGVFVGISFNDWAGLTMWNAATPQMRKSVFASSGSFTSYASGRLSYSLGLRGPCVSVNTACSSGLVALHGAYQAVATKDTSLSVAACTNAMLDPTISINFAVKGITSPRGRCHTLDASADGYMRSEACVAIALGPSSSESLGVSGIVVRHDGKSASLTAPNGAAQVAMLAATPASRDFYEAHGTATPLGDPIEVGALGRFLAKYTHSDAGVPLSGAKSAFGHGEAVAGAIGLLATILALRVNAAAPNGALKRINPAVHSDKGDVLCFPVGSLPVVPGFHSKQLAGGVSSLGASGTIAHAVISQNGLKDVLATPWASFPNRVSLPWTPWTPPEQKMASSSSLEKKPKQGNVLARVREICGGFLDEDIDDAVPLLDQGFDSLTAMELVSELQAAFEGQELPSTLLVDHPTIEAIAQLIDAASTTQEAPVVLTEKDENSEGADGPTVVTKKATTGFEAPLKEGEQVFFIHGVDGDPLAMLFHQLASELRFPSSTVRCIEQPKTECSTLEDLVAYYIAKVKERQPSGKYRIFGHSFGALIAHQMALQLERNGDEVAALILGDFEVSYPPSRSQGGGSEKGRFGMEEWEGGEIEAIKLACRRFGATETGLKFDPDAFREKVLANAKNQSERRMRAMFHYMPAYMQRREWDRLLDLWERNMEFLHTVTVPKFGPKRRIFWEPDGVVQGPTLHLRALDSIEFAAAETLNAKYCKNFRVVQLPGLHYTFLQRPHAVGVAKAIDDFIGAETLTTLPPPPIPAAPKAELPGEATLAGLVFARARDEGEKDFVVSWDREKGGSVETVTFRDFGQRCAATAALLSGSSKRTALLCHATVAAHVAIVAIAANGGAAVMLNPRLRVESLAAMISRVDGCGNLIAGMSYRPLAARVAPAVPALASTKTWILTNCSEDSLDLRHERPLDTTSQRTTAFSVIGSPDDAVVVMFTSGTTAAPKPIARSSRQILTAAQRMEAYERSKDIAGDGGTLSFLPLYHMMGFAHNFAKSVVASSKLLIHASAPSMPLTLGLLLEAAPILKPSSLESVAVVAEQLSEMLKVGGELARDIRFRFQSVKCLKVGGSKMTDRVVLDLAECLPVLEHYGQTELCGYVLAALTTKGKEKAIMEAVGVRVSLRGDDSFGELLVHSPESGETNATGDIFVAKDLGYTFKSRLDGMLVLGSGEMLEPVAIENRLLRDLARHVNAVCLAGNGRARPALLVELREPPSDTALDALTTELDAINADLDATTKILHTHVILLDECTSLPTNMKGAVDHSAAAALFEHELSAVDNGTLVPSSLQAFNLGYWGPKE